MPDKYIELVGVVPEPLGHAAETSAVFSSRSKLVRTAALCSVATALRSALSRTFPVLTASRTFVAKSEPVAGSYASILFAVGFIGSGVLAVPVLAASGAAGLSSLLNKDWGLDRSLRKAPLFYGLLGVGITLGTILAMLDTNPIGLLVLSAIVNGIAAGPFLVVIMLISRDKKLMGKYRNGRLAATVGWATAGIMCAAGVYGIWYTITGG